MQGTSSQLQLVLVTGANGFIGTHIVQDLLKDGYRVRGVVRRPSDRLTALFKPYGDKFAQVQVSDITEAGAFDQHLDGVDFIIHTASPMPSEKKTDYQLEYYTPAIKAVTGVLDSAYKRRNVKRVVITGSIADIFPPTAELTKGFEGHVFTEKDRMSFVNEDTPVSNTFDAYSVSKILADQSVWAWQAAHPDASFEIASIYNAATFGRNLTQETAAEISGTNMFLWGILTTGVPGFVNFAAHVDDVSRAHIIALDKSRIPNGSRLIVSLPYLETWNTAVEHAKKQWPERKWADVETPNPGWKFDNSESNRLLGIDYKSFESQIDDVVNQMIELGA